MVMTYAIALIGTSSGPCPVVEVGGTLYALSDLVPHLEMVAASDLVPLFENWDNAIQRLDAAFAHETLPAPIGSAADAEFLAPVQRPANLICAGSNYYDHLAKDFGITSFDKAANDILYFTKPAGSIVGPGKTVRYPSQSVAFDWEIELVVVIGKTGRRIPRADAMSHVAGYTIGLDLTARDLQFNKRQRRQFDLFGGKGFDDSAPLGPKIVPGQFVDPDDLVLKLRVNGETKQDSHTKEMIWTIPELIADVSQHVTLRPGDLLFTGSPAGVGHASGTYLRVGDRIEAEIGDLGALCVEIVEDPDSHRVWNRQALLAAAQG
jgi:2-keto-4-pentenoate hydratase/2-oxohepta-3-ene-1,7-dioic acid hydratase in catechol pathway